MGPENKMTLLLETIPSGVSGAWRSSIVPNLLHVPLRVWGYVMRDLKSLAGPGQGLFLTFYLRVFHLILAQNGLKKSFSALPLSGIA